MPTYDFRCPSCATLFEERRSFARADDPAVCPSCGGDRAAKVISVAEFYSPGSAARSLLDPGARQTATAAPHAAGCPCCSPKRSVTPA
ncbi:MAG TPA: zinc ribbon domain-containing protein [Thermomicrobiales bacterium]|jgi:putative FmdB family regulatory protein|nr:zinc ribbon domain-containing protein [Thermomicrobiales bacterium]